VAGARSLYPQNNIQLVRKFCDVRDSDCYKKWNGLEWKILRNEGIKTTNEREFTRALFANDTIRQYYAGARTASNVSIQRTDIIAATVQE